MKVEQLVTLVVRLFVIYFFLIIFFQSGMMLVGFIAGDNASAITARDIGHGVLLAILFVVLFALWRKPLFVLRGFMSSDVKDCVKISFSYDQVEALGFTLLGFLITTEGFVSVAQYLLATGFSGLSNVQGHISFWGHVGRLLIGLWILIGSKGIAKTLRKLRS